MKPIYDAWLIQIEITNACINRCAHCTRAVRHFKTPYFADLDFIEQALQSLKGWKRGVGCMGGEPTLHPDFPAICALYRKYFPRRQCGLFTSGGKKYQEYLPLIKETFGILHYHNHRTPSHHHPIMVASEEIVPDPKLRKRLIKECWLQRKWSPAISKKGCFFCEVAAMFDLLFDGPGGYPIGPNWWKRDEHDFNDQIERYCRLCSVAIPMASLPDDSPYDCVSNGNLERLRTAGSPLALKNELEVITEPVTREKIKETNRERKVKDPSRYARRDDTNYFCDSHFSAQVWAKNIKHEFYHFLRTGDLYNFYLALKPMSFPRQFTGKNIFRLFHK